MFIMTINLFLVKPVCNHLAITAHYSDNIRAVNKEKRVLKRTARPSSVEEEERKHNGSENHCMAAELHVCIMCIA